MKFSPLEFAIARASIVALVLLHLGCSALSAKVLGDKPTFGLIPEEVEIDDPLTATKTLASGERWVIGPLPIKNTWNERYYYQYTTESGDLASLTPENNHIVYIAPTVGFDTSDQLVFWRTTEDGSSRQIIVNLVISGSSGPAVASAGQFTTTYNAASSNFTANYTLQPTVTRAWIQASLDGVTFTNVATIDPVTAANRTGSRSVTVADSSSRETVWFRLRTQVGTAAAVDGQATAVNYSPPPPAPKSSELPVDPTLVLNGSVIFQPQVQMWWYRVNDSANRDNANHYEVQSATNPDFAGSSIVTVPNSATGSNLYESIFYIATGLQDNRTHYFRVRAVNNLGAGSWSNSREIAVRIQDGPVFATNNPVFPPNGATGITKIPALEVSVSDPDGDSLYTAFEISEDPGLAFGTRRYFGHGGQQDYLNLTRLDPSEWGSNTLKPNTRYYWRAIVQEEGRWLDYYGGTWPMSPIYSFTTENAGGSFVLSNPTLVSGTIRPFEKLLYRVTVTNNGGETSDANIILPYLVKNGIEHRFAYASWGVVPALPTGQSTTCELEVYFRDSLFTNQNGTVYDNILVPGLNQLRFKSSEWVINTPQSSVDTSVNWSDTGSPSISYFNATGYANGSISSLRATGQNEAVAIRLSGQDDIRISNVEIEYRGTPASNWSVIDQYSGGQSQFVDFTSMSHSGQTAVLYNGAITWQIPSGFGQRSTLQFRVSLTDQAGNVSRSISEPVEVYDGSFSMDVGATEFSGYRLGDPICFPVSLSKAPRVQVSRLTAWYGSPGNENEMLLEAEVLAGGGVRIRFQNGGAYSVAGPDWVEPNGGIKIPAIMRLTLPVWVGNAREDASIRVNASVSIPGVYSSTFRDSTNGAFRVSRGPLPAPFQEVPMFHGLEPNWPAGSIFRSNSVSPLVSEWADDSTVHAILQQDYSYSPTTLFEDIVNFRRYVWASFDRTNSLGTQLELPAGADYYDLAVVGGVPHILKRSGTTISMISVQNGAATPAQSVLSLETSIENTTAPEFVKLGSELFVASSSRNDTNGSNSSAWRSRLQRVVPSIAAVIEQPAYYGRHLDYSANFLNTAEGLFALGGDRRVTNQMVSWPFNGACWFSSTNSSIAGARWAYEGDHGVIKLVAPTGSETNWDAWMQDVRIHAFPDAIFAIGQGVYSSRPTEHNGAVIARRHPTTGSEERVGLLGYANSGRQQKVVAISQNKWIAALSGTNLAIGNFAGDITAPAVAIQTNDGQFTTGQSKAFSWTMTDNLNQLASVKVSKIVGGLETVIGNYTSGTLPTSLTHTFADTASRLILRVEAMDQSGNRGFAEQVLVRQVSFTLDSFTAGAYSVPMGTGAVLTWVATPADPFRVYTIETRPAGNAAGAWTLAASVTGNTHTLDTSLLSASTEVRLVSGAQSRTLAQVLSVSGNRFAYDLAGFSPAPGTIYVADANSVTTLQWASNQPEGPTTAYTVLVKWNGTGNFVVLGGGLTKSLEINVGTNTSLEWKVIAQWDGLEYSSTARTHQISRVAGGPLPVATARGLAAAAPWVDVTWPAVPGAQELIIYRKDTQADSVEEIARVPGTATSYRDDRVAFGDRVSYALATVLGEATSPAGAYAAVVLDPVLPLGLTFVNANNQLRPSNSNTVQWNPTLPAGVTAVYQDYLVVLRKGDGAIVDTRALTPMTTPAEVAYTGLEFNQSYLVQVFLRRQDGVQLSPHPHELNFSTGFDTRQAVAAAGLSVSADAYGISILWAAVTTADYYDVYRSTNGGASEWIGRVPAPAEGFFDGSASIGASHRYVIRSGNDNSQTDSPFTNAITRGTPFQLWGVAAGLTVDDSFATSDADGDGVSNLLEYAFGTTPTDRTSINRPTVVRLPNGELEYSFVRLSARSLLVYEVEASDDLQVWTPIARSSTGGVTQALGGATSGIIDAGGSISLVQVHISPSTTGLKKYLRMKVQEEP